MLKLDAHSYTGHVTVRQWGLPPAQSTVTVGKYCSLADGIVFYVNGNHPTQHFTTFPLAGSSHLGPVGKGCPSVGNDVWIGDNAVVCTGVHIGDGAVVGTNSVVTKSVPPYAIVAGNPARVVKYRFAPPIIERFLAVKWWDLPHDVIVGTLLPTLEGGVEETLAAAERLRAPETTSTVVSAPPQDQASSPDCDGLVSDPNAPSST